MAEETPGAFDAVRQFFALERDVFVLSVAMFAFSLSFQMTGRYIPEYMRVLGAGAGAIGLYGSLGNLIGAVYPYPGGALSDRIGSRSALTLFGVASTAGFVVWLFAEAFGIVTVGGFTLPVGALPLVETGVSLEPVSLPVGIFLGLFLTQAWKSFGLGATFAVVKQATAPEELATGFASTETFRRVGFLVGPLLAAGVLAATATFEIGFEIVLGIAALLAGVATVAQHRLYDASEDTIGDSFSGIGQILTDLRAMPSPLRPLLVADTLVRFANGMVYVFFVIVVTDFLAVGLSIPTIGVLGASVGGVALSPAAFFGLLLAVEMLVALVTMVPTAKLASQVGLKPVVALGFAVYAVFPVLLINAPANAAVVFVLFAFSGLRFAGLPAHKALIVGPAKSDAGGRVTGSYYLIRDAVRIPSAAIGGWIYTADPGLAFGIASAVGIVGTLYFLAFGEEFRAYA
ncbi:MAG: MFS transporter [Halobacteriales archaeon]